MTVEVRIENKDAARAITVETFDYDKDTRREVPMGFHIIQPGEAKSFYVHLLRDLRIRESKP